MSSQLPESEARSDSRWDKIIPRTLIFKRFFKALKRDASAVEMVEAMHECGMTPHFLETLPEAVLVPLQDAISLCQPHPPSSWSNDLLELVKRSDISLVLAPGKRSRPAMSNILVSRPFTTAEGCRINRLRPLPTQPVGTTSCFARALKRRTTLDTMKARAQSVRPSFVRYSKRIGA